MNWIIRIQLLPAIPLILLYWYVGVKLHHGCVNGAGLARRSVRRAILAVIAVFNIYPLVLLAGVLTNAQWLQSAVRGEIRPLDWFLAYPFWTGLVVTAELALVCLVTDLVRLLFFRVYRRDRVRWMHRQGIVLLCAAAIVVVYVPIRMYHDTATISVDAIERSIAGLPAGLDGVRIVQVSDIHVDARTNGRKLERLQEVVESQRPDFVFFNGDLVSTGKQYVDEAAGVIGGLRARYGTYACLGDHDAWSGSGLAMKKLRDDGVVIADDSTLMVRAGSVQVEITFVTNVYADRPPRTLLSRIDSHPAEFGILVVHQPSKWLVDSSAAHGYDLFLAGHTHGGQVALGIPWAPFIFSRIETPYVSGFYQVGKMLVSVTTGIGLTGAPVRFQAPSEISVITLRRQNP